MHNISSLMNVLISAFNTFFNALPHIENYIFYMNIFFIMVIIFFERKRPLFSLFWITLLSLTSFLGFFLYITFGLSFKKKRLTHEHYNKKNFPRMSRSLDKYLNSEEHTNWSHLINYLEVAGKCRFSTNNSVTFYNEGNELFENILKDLSKATTFIHMEYFIFKDEPELGRKIINTLKDKAQAGVEVRLIVDGVGCKNFYGKLKHELINAGVDVQIFFPMFLKRFSIRANYRTHRKIIIVDGILGYLGGFNIGKEYINLGKLGFWRDSHVKIIGAGVKELQKEFFSAWAFTKKQSGKQFFRDSIASDDALSKYYPNIDFAGDCKLQIIGSAPDYELNIIRDLFVKMILNAKKYIYIQTPYFIPDEVTFEALKMAALSGVKIKIMIPDKPDHRYVYWATTSFAGQLLDFGIDFYKYTNGFLHSKVIIVDDEVASLGTANFDNRSFFLNFEINATFYDLNSVKRLRNEFIHDLTLSRKFTKDEFLKRKIPAKILESIARLFSPIL